MLRERHDRMPAGSYAGDQLPDLSIADASLMINDLKTKIAKLEGKSAQVCPMCFVRGGTHLPNCLSLRK